MHVLALNKEGQWPYAEILLTTPGAFQEALNQVTIIEQQCIEYGLDSIKLDEIENFLLKAEKSSNIERKDNEDLTGRAYEDITSSEYDSIVSISDQAIDVYAVTKIYEITDDDEEQPIGTDKDKMNALANYLRYVADKIEEK